MHLLLTRPLSDSEATARKLQDLGHSSLIEPLLSLEWLDEEPLDTDQVQAILLTSNNAALALARQAISRDIPIFAVGAATAAAASEAGFNHVNSADGDVFALARLVARSCRPEDGEVLHLAGEDTAGDLAGSLERSGLSLRRVVVYRARPARQFSEAAVEALKNGDLDGILLFSPRTATTFTQLLAREALTEGCSELDLYALSQAVSHAVGELTFRHRHIPKYPSQADLLALLA